LLNQIQRYVQEESFQIPIGVHLVAGFLFSLTGALAAMRRGYDVVGVFLLALVAGTGGGLMRDGLFLQQGPPVVARDWRYLPPVLAACLVGWVVNHWIVRFEKVIAVLDAVGLSVYTLVGFLASIKADLSVPAAILVGMINAAGGGLLRDILTHEEPLVFKPGQFYVLASFAGCFVFIALAYRAVVTPPTAARMAMAATFILRILAIFFNWRTSPMQPWFTPDTPPMPKDPPTSDPPKGL
jgi:uncharacterized membrane protein YeiH